MQCGCGKNPRQKHLEAHRPACFKRQASLGALVVQERATAIGEVREARTTSENEAMHFLQRNTDAEMEQEAGGGEIESADRWVTDHGEPEEDEDAAIRDLQYDVDVERAREAGGGAMIGTTGAAAELEADGNVM